MARLYLHCALCSRKQAEGLISGAAWGRFDVPDDAQIEHPAYRGTTLRACPTCIQRHTDWRERLLTALGLSNDGVQPYRPVG
jgi:hypothetical protein